MANVEPQAAVKPETVFQSGSLGKQFTATAVMMLVEEGKVGLDDSITRYLPEAPAAWKPVTVRELLSHTAGFTDYPKDFDFRRDYSEEQLLKIIAGIPLAFPPGTGWQYSNLGCATLGILIHRVTGEFYGDFLEERIFRPLGMTTTRIISEADIIPNRAGGYRLVKGELKNQEWVAPSVNTTADGSLYFSILDLANGMRRSTPRGSSSAPVWNRCGLPPHSATASPIRATTASAGSLKTCAAITW